MASHPETFEEFFNDKAYKKAQAENDEYRKCLIEVQRKTRNNWIKKLISTVLQGNKDGAHSLLTGDSEAAPFISENDLLEESQIYNANIEYGEAFQMAWTSLSRNGRRYVRDSIDETMTEEMLSVADGQHERVKYKRSSGYPRKTIKSIVAGELCYYWSPVAIRNGLRVIYMLDITKNEI